MPTNWLTAISATAATDVKVSFPTPTGAPTVGAGLQLFRALLRKTAGASNPTIDMELWETGGGSALATLLDSTAITSTTGQIVEGTWNASLLGTADGSAVQCRIVVSTPYIGSTPTFVAKGTLSATTASSMTPTYPTGMAEGDLLILVVGSTTSSAANTITTPASPWQLKHALGGSSSDGQIAIYWRIVPAGGLSGTLSIDCTTPTANAALYAQFYAFRGIDQATPFEGGALSSGSGTTVTLASVTTAGANRLCVAFTMVGSQSTMASATGESGGDWTEAVAEDVSATGDDGTLQLQTAALAAAGTISGGTVTVTTGGWACRAFALVPPLNTVEIGAVEWAVEYTLDTGTVSLDSGAIAAPASTDLLAPSTVTLDTSTAPAVAGFDLTTLEARTITLDDGAITVAGEDFASASLAIVLDDGAITAAGSDLLLPSVVGLDAGALTVTGNDLAVDLALFLDDGTATVAGSDITPLVASSILLDNGAITVAGADLSLATQPTLDMGGVVVAGTNVTIIGVGLQPLDSGSIAAAANDLAPCTGVALDVGAIALQGGDLDVEVMVPAPFRTLSVGRDERVAFASGGLRLIVTERGSRSTRVSGNLRTASGSRKVTAV